MAKEMHSRDDRPTIAPLRLSERCISFWCFPALNAPTKHFVPDQDAVVYEPLWHLYRPLLHWESGKALRSLNHNPGAKSER